VARQCPAGRRQRAGAGGCALEQRGVAARHGAHPMGPGDQVHRRRGRNVCRRKRALRGNRRLLRTPRTTLRAARRRRCIGIRRCQCAACRVRRRGRFCCATRWGEPDVCEPFAGEPEEPGAAVNGALPRGRAAGSQDAALPGVAARAELRLARQRQVAGRGAGGGGLLGIARLRLRAGSALLRNHSLLRRRRRRAGRGAQREQLAAGRAAVQLRRLAGPHKPGILLRRCADDARAGADARTAPRAARGRCARATGCRECRRIRRRARQKGGERLGGDAGRCWRKRQR